MLLPFRTRRFEKNNNNGERKQIRYEIKRIRVNERVKKRQRLLREQKMHEIRKMIENGELSLEALKWKVRSNPPPEATASTGIDSIIKDEMCHQSKFYGIKSSQDGFLDLAEKEIQ